MGWMVSENTATRKRRATARYEKPYETVIYTSFYGDKNYQFLRDAGCQDRQLVNIARSPGRWGEKDIRAIEKLYPSWDIVQKYKNAIAAKPGETPEQFESREHAAWKTYLIAYMGQLERLDPTEILGYLQSTKEDMVIMCFEDLSNPNTPHCHRQLVAAWLHAKLGIKIREWKGEKINTRSDYTSGKKTKDQRMMEKDAEDEQEYTGSLEEDVEITSGFEKEKAESYRTTKEIRQDSVGFTTGMVEGSEALTGGAYESHDIKMKRPKGTKARFLFAPVETRPNEFREFKSKRRSLLVAGSRKYPDETEFKDQRLVDAILDAVVRDGGFEEIISGGAPQGVDQMAIVYARKRGMYFTVVPAPWDDAKKTWPVDEYGQKWRGAGNIRNAWMAELCDEGVVIFADKKKKSHGSANMEEQLKRKDKLISTKLRATSEPTANVWDYEGDPEMEDEYSVEDYDKQYTPEGKEQVVQ